MKVLIGVDGSEGGFAAVRFASQLLAAPHDQVTLYYTPPDIRPRSGAVADPQMLLRARQALAAAVFEPALKCLPSTLATAAKTVMGTKNPRQGVVLAAEECRADLIVVGARGGGPISNLLMGSVATSVAHSARIPVLVVRTASVKRAGEPLRVLLASDGSDASQQAATLVGNLQWPTGSVGRVMTVIESLTAGAVPEWLEAKARDADSEAMAQAWAKEHEAEKQEKLHELHAFRGQLPAPFQETDPLVVEGHPAEQILHAIGADSSDLVVLGSQGKGLLERWLMGSTSEKILHNAPCSVLLVRQHEKP